MIYEPDEELKGRKKAAALTDRDLAREIGRSPSAVSRMLNGFALMPTAERVRMMALCDRVARAREGEK